MRRVREHVDRAAALELVAVLVAEDLQIRGERRRVAGDVDEPRRHRALQYGAVPCPRGPLAADRRRRRPGSPPPRGAPRSSGRRSRRRTARSRFRSAPRSRSRTRPPPPRSRGPRRSGRSRRARGRSCPSRSRGRRRSRLRSGPRTRARARRDARPCPVFVCRNADGRTRNRRPRSSSSIASSPHRSFVGRFVCSAGVSLIAQWIERTSGKAAEDVDEVPGLEPLAGSGDEHRRAPGPCCAPRARRGGAGTRSRPPGRTARAAPRAPSRGRRAGSRCRGRS